MRIEPKKIMCAIDFSDFTHSILTYGKALASEYESKLYLCHIVQGALMVSNHMTPYLDYAGIETERIQQSRNKLEKMTKAVGIDCEILISSGHPADEINQIARENDVDMVIAATHGGAGFKRFMIGSVTNRLMKILSCPLLVLHSTEKPLISEINGGIKLNRILVGCDFSSDSKLAFDYALSLAQEFQTQLYLAHVSKPVDETALTQADYHKIQAGELTNWSRSEYMDLQKAVSDEAWQKKSTLLSHIENQLLSMVPDDCRHFCTPVTILLEGQPYKELINYAENKEVDMIVLGIRGHSLFEQFWVGSTTDRVISHASCPVLAVRPIN